MNKNILLILLLLIFGVAIIFARQTQRESVSLLPQNSPVPHDSQGNIAAPIDVETTSSVMQTFENTKYGYRISYLKPTNIVTDITENFAHDIFEGRCLHIFIVPRNMMSKYVDDKIIFPLRSIKQLTALSVGEKEEFPSGYMTEGKQVMNIYTRLEDGYLGNQKATVFEYGNTHEMLGNIRYFYTQKNSYHYIVAAYYNGSCSETEAIDTVSNFQFLE